MTTDTPLLSMTGIQKRFRNVHALRAANFELRAGEVHVLIGENGAGKSTLMKVLCGQVQCDGGEMRLGGEPIAPATPLAAARLGIVAINQEQELIPHLTVAENLVLGDEPSRFGVIDGDKVRAKVTALLAKVGAQLPLDAPVGTLSVAQQQLVEIAKSLRQESRVLVMDEPTAALADAEIEQLFALIRSLTQKGVAVVYISHRMKEIFTIADRITVMRDGETVGTRPVGEFTEGSLIELMIGRSLDDRFPERQPVEGAVMLELRECKQGKWGPVSLQLRAGEILGVGGLMGSGRTRLAKLLFGVETLEHGTVRIGDEARVIRSPSDAIAAGLGFVTDDRKALGLIPMRSVRENTTLASLDGVSSLGRLSLSKEATVVDALAAALSLKTASIAEPVMNLSGGNQQKVVLAKWLATRLRVLILDEPTRGIDVGAKAEIYRLIHEVAAKGAAVLLISSDMPELLGLSHRVVVMHDGQLAGTLEREEATQERVMSLALGLA